MPIGRHAGEEGGAAAGGGRDDRGCAAGALPAGAFFPGSDVAAFHQGVPRRAVRRGSVGRGAVYVSGGDGVQDGAFPQPGAERGECIHRGHGGAVHSGGGAGALAGEGARNLRSQRKNL